MSQQAINHHEWDLSQVSSLASSLSVDLGRQKRHGCFQSCTTSLSKSADPLLTDITTLGDFSQVWSYLEPVRLSQFCRTSLSTQHRNGHENYQKPSLADDDCPNYHENLKSGIKATAQDKLNLPLNSDHVGKLETKFLHTYGSKKSCQVSAFAESSSRAKELHDVIATRNMRSMAVEVNDKEASEGSLPVENCSLERLVLEPSYADEDEGVKLVNGQQPRYLPNKGNVMLSDRSATEVNKCFSQHLQSLQLGTRPEKNDSISGSLMSVPEYKSRRPDMVPRPHKSLKIYRRQGMKASPDVANPTKETKHSNDGICDGHLSLLIKLLQNFREDRKWLVKPVQFANHTCSPNGIHIFVDFSNLSIGFNNYLKILDGISVATRTKFRSISFEALVLLMERRRPVSKRVLAGSLPYVPAFKTAEAIGYELNILDKVLRAKETQLPIVNSFSKPKKLKRSSYQSSKPETTSNTLHNTEKWVEQGVDEILHLKILESVIDVESPTTIVLGTGDGAIAEFSQGFFAMVERALRNGWYVELVSWSHNIGHAYKRRSFRKQWGPRFRIIELDDYAKELKST